MSTCRANCIKCGDVTFNPPHTTIVIMTGQDRQYRWRCPRCGLVHLTAPSRPNVIDQLLAAGARRQYITTPREQRPAGAPFTEDDQIILHERWADETTFRADVETLA